MEAADVNKRELRVLKFLSKGEAALQPASAAGSLLLDGGDRGALGVSTDVVAAMKAAGLVTLFGECAAITEYGRAALKRVAEAAGPLQAQKQDIGSAVVETAAGAETVAVNEAESPLAALWRRRNRNGRQFLSAREFRAGERLRSDYSRGHIMQRLGVDWTSFGGGAGSGGSHDGLAELTEAALSARQRVERAIAAVGPELSGVLIDVCCFLKGLERVEAERGWPVRSAKVVLKSALGALARHYEPPAAARRDAGAILHWGTADYRPSIS